MLTVVHDAPVGDQPTLPETPTTDLDELCRMAAQQMLALALEAERRAYLESHAHLLDDNGHRLVVGNGHQPVRDVVTGAGAVEVRKPRVDDPRDGHTFVSAILPPYMRRSAKAPRCCRCCICAACPPATSPPRWPSSSAPTPGCQPPPSND